MSHQMVIYKTVPVRIKVKMQHVRKIGGKVYGGIIDDYGDVPVGSWNDITKKMEPVVNNRGYAYAARGRLKYRNKKK